MYRNLAVHVRVWNRSRKKKKPQQSGFTFHMDGHEQKCCPKYRRYAYTLSNWCWIYAWTHLKSWIHEYTLNRFWPVINVFKVPVRMQWGERTNWMIEEWPLIDSYVFDTVPFVRTYVFHYDFRYVVFLSWIVEFNTCTICVRHVWLNGWTDERTIMGFCSHSSFN